MFRITLALSPLLLLSISAIESGAAAQDVRLRRVDSATVRIIGVAGVRTARIRSEASGVDRLPALPTATHGTGVVIGTNGLVMTARHVVEAMDIVAVVFPGQSSGVPARVIYSDSDHDLAVLKVAGPPEDHIRMPAANPSLSMGGRVSASGYPLDHRERYPAAVSGVISRLNNDGTLQLAIGVNPGNSGGPVIDEDERLIGILSRRGRPEAGVESIGIVEPMRFVRAAYERGKRRAAETSAAGFSQHDHRVARLLTDLVRTADEQPIYEQTSVTLISEAASSPETPEAAAVIAAHAWNMSLALLEERGSVDASSLSGDDRATTERLLAISLRLARQVDSRAPYIRIRYPVIRSILVSNGRPFLPAE